MEQAPRARQEAEDLHKALRQAAARGALLNSRERLTGQDMSEYRPRVTHLQSIFDPYLELWRCIDRYLSMHDVWYYGPFFAFAVHDLEASVPQWLKVRPLMT